MAADWIGTFATAVVPPLASSALTGIITYRVTKRSVDGESTRATDERQQARRSETYVAVLQLSHAVAARYEAEIVNLQGNVLAYSLQPQPTDSDVTFAKLLAFGSAEVLKRYKVMENAFWAARQYIDSPAARADPQWRIKLTNVHDQIRDRVDDLRSQIRLELGGDPLPEKGWLSTPVG